MARAFVYHIRDGEKLRRLRAVLLRRGIDYRPVSREEYGHPVGYLCGREGFAPRETYTGPEFREEMLLLEGLSYGQLSELLDELRAARATVALKAVVTDTNAAWTSAALYTAVWEEHRSMQALRKG